MAKLVITSLFLMVGVVSLTEGLSIRAPIYNYHTEMTTPYSSSTGYRICMTKNGREFPNAQPGKSFKLSRCTTCRCTQDYMVFCRRRCPSAAGNCKLPKVVGPCKAAKTRFYYNTRTQKCVQFSYGGCRGNANNFKTLDHCKNACDKCHQPKKTGMCRAAFRRFYYNTKTNKCQQFTYGGCGANANNFRSLERCNKACNKGAVTVRPTCATMKCSRGFKCEMQRVSCVKAPCPRQPACVPSVDICQQPKKTGPCRGAMRRFYYNAVTKTCQSFTYGGCKGNGNNFRNLDSCNEACVKGVRQCKLRDGTVVKGKQPGDRFKLSACKFCRCTESYVVYCAQPRCARPACSNPVRVKGVCCAVCPKATDCKYNGIVVLGKKPGDSYKKGPCTSCQCGNDGIVMCMAMSCAMPYCGPGVQAVKPTGQCCPSCPKDVDDCTADPCKNGGTCTTGINGTTCTCKDGFEGKTCQTNIDDCTPEPCVNGGTCRDQTNGFTCDCPTGFTGDKCQTNIDDCTPEPCVNGGTCRDQTNGFTCDCPTGFTGDKCQTNIDDCTPEPCVNGGTCRDQTNGFTCDCPTGFTGDKCQTNIDDCTPEPCVNGGTCRDQTNGFTCDCPTGFTGDKCQTNIDDCTPEPCVNGGTCRDQTNGFTCDCPTGFTGDKCQTNIDDCTPEPCVNGGTCRDQTNGFTCDCPTGFTGDKCQTNIDDCTPEPCVNGGTCRDQTNGFTCDCPTGFTGDKCQTSCKLDNGTVLVNRTPGDSFDLEACLPCTCKTDGTVECTTIPCAMPTCTGNVIPRVEENECCPTCPEAVTCRKKDNTEVKAGDTWILPTNSCVRCTCNPTGIIKCTPICTANTGK